MKKLLNANCISTALVAVLTLISFILYIVNISSEGYYKGMTVSGVILFSILVIVLAAVIILASGFLHLDGMPKKIVDLCIKAFKIVLPVFLLIVAVSLISSRVNGLGYIYFSNADVAKEVGTPANLASASLAITTIVFFVVDALVAIVASFFSAEKEVAA